MDQIKIFKIIKNYKKIINKEPIEMVERKGIGHPDTLADLIAENFSNNYSKYCLNKFGCVLNHWVDKVLLSGGTAELDFGRVKITRPITAYLFGRVTKIVGNERIDIDGLFKKSAEEVLLNIFRGQKICEHINYMIDVNQTTGKEHPREFYFPRSADDIKKCWDALSSNDTIMCSGYAPYSSLEKIVINLENYINSKEFKKRFPETGWDVKVMATRTYNKIDITVSLPFIARLTPSYEYYSEKIELAKKKINNKILSDIKKFKTGFKLSSLSVNTKDRGEFVYLTSFGTALDKGDYGMVGRGNKYSGAISLNRESNIEATAGKNPMNHSGKLYTILANDLSWEIHKITSGNVYLNIAAKNGDRLTAPNFMVVKCEKPISKLNEKRIKKIIEKGLNSVIKYYEKIINLNVIESHISRKNLLK